MSQLTRYDAARSALSAAVAVDEVKDIRNKAIAMETYARQAKDGQMIADATEIRDRATRKLGEMMKAQKDAGMMNEGGRPTSKTGFSKNPVSTVTLNDVGIDKNLANAARKAAAMPAEQFELHIADQRAAAISGEKKNKKPPAAKQDHALKVFDRLKADGAEPATAAELAKAADVSEGTAARAMVRRRLEAEVAVKAGERPAKIDLGKEQNAEFNRRMRELEKKHDKRMRELEEDFKIRVHQEAETWVFKHKFPAFAQRVENADKIIAAHKGLWTKKQFHMVLKCLHSDYCKAPEADDAFRLVHMGEPVLRQPDPPAQDPNRPKPRPLPKTLSEMLILQKQMKAERAAERKRRAEARAKGSDLPVRS